MGAVKDSQKRCRYHDKPFDIFTVPPTRKMPGGGQALSYGDLGCLISLNIFVIRRRFARREPRDAGFYFCSKVCGGVAAP